MAGVMAALSAREAGWSVLLVEPSNVLGGQGTAGGVAGFCGDTTRVNHLFDELVERLARHDLIAPIIPTADRRDYDLEWCAFFLQEMAVERGVDILLHARVIGAQATEGRITGLSLATAGGILEVAPRFVIDCSGSCVVPVLTGFPVMHEGANRQLPMSLYFTMWNTGSEVTPILPEGCPRWTNEDEIPMTSLHIFPSGKTEVKMKVVGFDAVDGRSRSQAEIFARRYMHGLIYFLQTIGYRGVKLNTSVLASVSRSIGIREENRVVGEHILTEEEVRRGAIFEDAVAVCAYHLDYHWPDRMQRGTLGFADMLDPHHLPFRMMIPRGAKNLLVAGRGASSDQMAMSAFRVMVPVAQLGFAAGIAAGLCLETGAEPAAIDVPELQRRIRAGGQSLDLSDYGGFLRHELFVHEALFADDRPFPACHASTLVQLPNARFLVAWFGGSFEGAGDVGIWAAERRERRWSPPRLVAKISDEPHWNPVLAKARDGSLRLYFKTGPTPQNWRTWLQISRDEGRTWEPPVPLGDGSQPPVGPVKNKPLVLADGAWLGPNSVETGERWDASVDRSTDEGMTWEQGAAVPLDHARFPGPGVIQPALWESAPGKVHMLLRGTSGRVCRSDSEDGGRTWAPVYDTDLPHPNTGLDACRLEDGTVALVFNPCPPDRPPERSPLTVALSFDNGKTWPRRLDLETGPGEYSYPAIIPTRTGLAITYTWNRERIMFWHGSIERIPEA